MEEVKEDASMEEPMEPTMEEVKEVPKGDAAEGKTIFVRNLPYNATREAVKGAMAELGDVVSVHLVRDKTTGLPTGTGFIKFKETPEVPPTLEFQNRELLLSMAQVEGPRNEIEAPKKLGNLADEGFIGRGTPAAKRVPLSEIERREVAWTQKKRKLTNPLFFVNPQRLSFRNMNDRVDDKKLADLCPAATQVKVLDFCIFLTQTTGPLRK